MAELIYVTPRKRDNRVIVWEVHPAHPAGECYIVGDGRTYTVAPTPRIRRLLDDGTLLRVEDLPESGAGAQPETSELQKAVEADVTEVLESLANDEEPVTKPAKKARK